MMYVEAQVGLQCGKHATNMLLGYPYPVSVKDMDDIEQLVYSCNIESACKFPLSNPCSP